MAYNKEQIQKILEDIYAVDSELRGFEKELIEAINVLLASKPNVRFDEKFIKKLRKEILAKAEIMKAENKTEARSVWFFAPLVKNYSFIAFLAVAFAAIQVFAFYGLGNNFKTAVNNGDSGSGNASSRFVQLQEMAFGKLSQTPASTSEGDAVARSSAVGLGGGGGGSDMSMIAPDPLNYRYVYNGDINLDQDKMEVFKRIKDIKSVPGAENILKNSGIDMVDFDSFSDLRLQNASFVEDKDYGLAFYLSLEDGSMSIYENWARWHHDVQLPSQLSISDIPEDSVIIALADEFVRKHGVNMESYEAGIVANNWRENYARAENKAEFYIPDSITVVYPLKIKDRVVYNDSAEKDGLYVNVNARERKVSGLWNIISNRYESSLYDVETDEKRIKSFVEKGGMYGYFDQNFKTIDIELGDPEIVYLKTYVYNDMKSDELIVPALVFPVVKAPEGQMYFRKNIIVPIVKDILDRFEQNQGGPVIMEGGAMVK